MSQWGNTDDAANSPFWAVAQFKVVANTANRTALFANSSANNLGTNQTVATYAVSAAEAKAGRLEGGGVKAAHSGHVVRVVGQGGRSGRVQIETLVAMGNITGDFENTVFKDVALKITSNPVNNSANVTGNANQTAVFTVQTVAVPEDLTLNYQWQANTGSGFANAANVSRYSGATTPTLTVFGNTNANQTIRVVVSATGATTKTSTEATFTVTT